MKNNIMEPSTLINFMKVTYGEIEIFNQDIYDFELHYDVEFFGVHGVLTFKDNFDMMYHSPEYKDKVLTIYYNDLADIPYSRTFYVADITESRGTNNTKFTHFKFMDRVSYTLRNTYFSKSYKNKKLSDVIEDVWKIYSLDSLIDTQYVKREFKPTKIVHDSIIIPHSKNLYDWFNFQINKEGYIWFMQKDKLILDEIKTFFPNNLAKEEGDFIEDCENPLYEFKILDSNKDSLSNVENLKTPTNTSLWFDPSKKKMIKLEQNLEELYSAFDMVGKDEKYVQNTDGKSHTILEINSKEFLAKTTYLTFLKNTTLDIFVPGRNKENKLFQRRTVLLAGNFLHNEGRAEGDKVFSSDYIIYKIRDKFINKNLLTKITLGRVNISAKK